MRGHRRFRAIGFLASALLLGACSAALPSTPPVSDSATTGVYRLDLTIDRTTWRAGDLITGTSVLTNTGSSQTAVYSSGMGLVWFEFKEVGGTRDLGNVMSASCSGYDLKAGSPVTTRVYANGAASNGGADAWIGSANDHDGARLPAGTWDVIVHAGFTEGECGGARVPMRASARVTVLA